MTQTNAASAEKEIKAEDIEAIVNAMAKGATPSDVAGVSQEKLEALYTLGHHLYSSGNFGDAETAFKALCLYDYHDPRFWLGLGAALQAQNKYELATEVYAMAGLNTGLADPTPFYYAGLCFLKQGKLEEAEGAWKSLNVMGEPGNPYHEAVKAKAAGMLAALEASKNKGGGK